MSVGVYSRRPADEENLSGVDSRTPLLSNTSRFRYQYTSTIQTLCKIIFSDYINVLLIFLPLGIVSGAIEWAPQLTFVFNFLALIALASLLSFATEELSKKVGQTVGGLLNASFGNATELIVSIVALRQGQIKLVQASMLGSILSSLLLV
jgi:Ca2+:H+ antiporter